MNNSLVVSLAGVALIVAASMMAYGQQPTPAAKPIPPPSTSPAAPIHTQAVQPPESELATVTSAWSEMKSANLALQLAVTKVQLNHPGWKYDYVAQTFYVELPAMPQPPLAPPAAVAAPVKMPQPPAAK